jgi:hypothetical protein
MEALVQIAESMSASGPEADNSAAAGKPARDVNAIALAADQPNLRKRHLRRLAISK